MSYKIHNGSLYSYTAGVLSGVLVKEKIMRKLVKLQAKHLAEVKRVLMDGADKEEVFASMWTLHYPQGKQTVANYIDLSRDVREDIKHAVISHPPQHHPLVFIASSMEEARCMADSRFKELGDEP